MSTRKSLTTETIIKLLPCCHSVRVKLNQCSIGMKTKLLFKAFAGRQTKGHEILGTVLIF